MQKLYAVFLWEHCTQLQDFTNSFIWIWLGYLAVGEFSLQSAALSKAYLLSANED